MTKFDNDLHSHLRSDVDDGAQTLEQSLKLARLAVTEGVEHMVLTPHHRNGTYFNRKQDVVKAADELISLYREHDIKLKVHASQEIRLTESFFDDFYNDDLLPLDATGRYYLIEFPTATIPDYALTIIKEIIIQGITPVIAHPERNHVFAKDKNVLYDYINVGCLAQITSSSYCGYYGEKLQETAKQMIELNLVHILASDVHHLKHRPINLEAAFKQLEVDFGREKVTYFKDNARAIFNGDTVPILKPQKVRKKWLGLF